MKKISTQTLSQMATHSISHRHVARGARPEILSALRQFARAYRPMSNNLPGLVLN